MNDAAGQPGGERGPAGLSGTSRYPRIVGFEVPPLKGAVDVIRDAPIVGLLDNRPAHDWVDAFIIEAACTQGPLRTALVSIEGDRILFFASANDGRARCDALRAMVERVGSRLVGAVPQPVAGQGGTQGDMGQARRVLVVEDDPDLLEIACDALAGAGWMPHPAGSSIEALAALEAGNFDAVMADIDLDEREDGLALARTVRRRWPQTGVLTVTGRHADSALDLPEGALFLGKPYQRRQLLAMLDLACAGDRGARA